MNNLEHSPTRHLPRSRMRNMVAVSVLWASVATFAATDTASATNGARAAVDVGTRNASTATALKGLALITAAPAPVHGVAPDGSELNGTFKLRRFQERRGVLYAVGKLTGVLGTSLVNQTVQLPVTGATNEPLAEGFRTPVPTPGACDILTLALGPLDLDLLGLRVALDEINLLIEAVPGAGNLLGNLLCAVAGLLDGGLGGGLGGLVADLLSAIANLLNGLLGL
jgi:hypothetical protein